MKEEVPTLDLRKLARGDLTVEALEAAFGEGDCGSREVKFQTAFLSYPILSTCHEGGDENSHQAGEATVAIAAALQALTPLHLTHPGRINTDAA